MSNANHEHDDYVRALEVIAEASETVTQELEAEVVREAHDIAATAALREMYERSIVSVSTIAMLGALAISLLHTTDYKNDTSHIMSENTMRNDLGKTFMPQEQSFNDYFKMLGSEDNPKLDEDRPPESES